MIMIDTEALITIDEMALGKNDWDKPLQWCPGDLVS